MHLRLNLFFPRSTESYSRCCNVMVTPSSLLISLRPFSFLLFTFPLLAYGVAFANMIFIYVYYVFEESAIIIYLFLCSENESGIKMAVFSVANIRVNSELALVHYSAAASTSQGDTMFNNLQQIEANTHLHTRWARAIMTTIIWLHQPNRHKTVWASLRTHFWFIPQTLSLLCR